jgi:intracellular septation protein A
MDNSYSLLFGVLPLLVFVIIDSFSSLKWALISASIFAVIEALATYIIFDELDIITFFSCSLVVIFAAISYFKKTDLFFKLQPVILGSILGMALIISYLIERPLLYEMLVKYQSFMPPNIQNMIVDPFYILIYKTGTFFSGIFLILHALVTLYAALKMSKWWWLIIRGIGVYLFLLLSFIATIFYVKAINGA